MTVDPRGRRDGASSQEMVGPSGRGGRARSGAEPENAVGGLAPATITAPKAANAATALTLSHPTTVDSPPLSARALRAKIFFSLLVSFPDLYPFLSDGWWRETRPQQPRTRCQRLGRRSRGRHPLPGPWLYSSWPRYLANTPFFPPFLPPSPSSRSPASSTSAPLPSPPSSFPPSSCSSQSSSSYTAVPCARALWQLSHLHPPPFLPPPHTRTLRGLCRRWRSRRRDPTPPIVAGRTKRGPRCSSGGRPRQACSSLSFCLVCFPAKRQLQRQKPGRLRRALPGCRFPRPLRSGAAARWRARRSWLRSYAVLPQMWARTRK